MTIDDGMTALVGVGCEALSRCITVRSLRALTRQVDCSFLSRVLYYASLRCIYLSNLQRSNTFLYFKPPLIEHTAIPGPSLILLSLPLASELAGTEALAECAEDHSAASGVRVTSARCSILPFNNGTQPQSPW